MNRIAVIMAALAVLVLATGAVAAVPADAPVDVPADDHPAEDPAPANETDTNETHMNDTHAQDQAVDNPGQAQAQNENRSDAAGPPIEMPDPVPDKVSQIHEMVRGFIDGDLDGSLGDAISDFLGQGADAADSPDDGSADSQRSQDA